MWRCGTRVVVDALAGWVAGRAEGSRRRSPRAILGGSAWLQMMADGDGGWLCCITFGNITVGSYCAVAVKGSDCSWSSRQEGP